jgi:hypothetical protein
MKSSKNGRVAVCTFLVCFIVGWVMFWGKCSRDRSLIADDSMWNGSFVLGHVHVRVSNPYQTSQKTSVRIRGIDALEFSNKTESDRTSRWVNSCLSRIADCCMTPDKMGNSIGLELCFFGNGNVTMLTDKKTFALKPVEGKYLLHVLARNFS